MLLQSFALPGPSMTFLTKERRVQFSEELPQEIHSGHFMVSNLDDSESESDDANTIGNEESSKNVPVNVDPPLYRDKNRLDFEELESLFKFLDIAYTDKLTSPKWNQFHGMRCAVKYKIRLNNVIWREYHMQFLKNIKPFVVHFQPPPLDNHIKSEVTILEGQYWKRRSETICAEYNRWRKFTRNKILGFTRRSVHDRVNELFGATCQFSIPRSSDDTQNSVPSVDSLDPTFGSIIDDIMMDFDENLDLFFGKPLAFPTPKELALLGIGDIMQPGLLQFQPDNNAELDELMLSSSVGGQTKRFTAQRPSYLSELPAGPSKQDLDVPVPTTDESLQQLVFHTAHIPPDVTTHVPLQGFETPLQPMNNDRAHFAHIESSISTLLPPSPEAHSTPIAGQTQSFSQIQDRHDRDQISSRTFTKHGHQQTSLTPPRSYPSKRHRGTMLDRAKKHPSPAGHQSDRALKHAFRNLPLEYSVTKPERERYTSETPALLNALLHGTKLDNAEPLPPFRIRTHIDAITHPNRSAPSLSTNPIPSGASHSGFVPRASDQYASQNQPDPTHKPRYCYSEPHRFQGVSSLVTDCPKASAESETLVDEFPSYISKIQSTDAYFAKQSDSSTLGKQAGSDQISSFAHQLRSNVGQTDLATSQSAMLPSGGSNQFVVPADVPSVPNIVNLEKRWSECSGSHLDSVSEPFGFTRGSTSTSRKLNFFLPSSSVDSGGGEEIMSGEMSTFLPAEPVRTVEVSLSARGRSSSAGNLFPLHQQLQPLSSQSMKRDSINTISSLGSEIQQQLSCSPSSCASQATIQESDSPTKPVSNNSSEERRRHLLETLRKYIKFFGVHHHSVRKLEDREPIRTYSSSLSSHLIAEGTFSVSDKSDASSGELLPLLKRPTCIPSLSSDPHRSGGSAESNNRMSYSSTLLDATALIRMLRDACAKRDAQVKSLMNEIGAIQTATAACWEKMDPMGTIPSRQLTEANITVSATDSFHGYTEQRTKQCWKFYVFSLFLWHLFQSYWSSVNLTCVDQFVRSLYAWIDQHCSRAQLRPAMMEALCKLATTTNVLQDPNGLPDQSLKAVHQQASSFSVPENHLSGPREIDMASVLCGGSGPIC